MEWTVIRRGTVGSTMDEAMVLAEAGAKEGTIVVADHQTAGRGRAGRRWTERPGEGLLSSVILRPSIERDRLGTLPLVIGVAVAEALEEVALIECQLKWPNDVWVEGKKIAGILTTTVQNPANRTTLAIVGIGINVNAPFDALADGATSVAVSRGQPVDREALLRVLVERLGAAYGRFKEMSGVVDLEDWCRRAELIGEHVQIVQDRKVLTGIYEGIDDRGALLLATANGGMCRIVSGDLVRGPSRIH
jgi:BirA family biotin operon repressor/biotin-[acetyl-CoA-carboxylase] ligase